MPNGLIKLLAVYKGKTMTPQTKQALEMSIEAIETCHAFIINAGFYEPLFGYKAINACKEALQSEASEAVAWIYEDELPSNYPYDLMFPYSKVDTVRMFPVFLPNTLLAQSEASEQEPVAWGCKAIGGEMNGKIYDAWYEQSGLDNSENDFEIVPLFTHPHQCQECENLKHDLESYMEANKALINEANEQEHNFCSRCGKRASKDPNHIHTCTPPQVLEQSSQEPVGEVRVKNGEWFGYIFAPHLKNVEAGDKLYTRPTEYKTLTDEEALKTYSNAVVKVIEAGTPYSDASIALATSRAIEQAIAKKNGFNV